MTNIMARMTKIKFHTFSKMNTYMKIKTRFKLLDILNANSSEQTAL